MRRVPHTFALAAMAALAIAAPAAAQPATWDIDSAHSAAQFAIKHMMVSTVRGDLGKITGKATYDGKDYSTVQVDASIDTTGINTREPKRDEHLKSPDFFDVSKHPTITFKSKRAEAAGGKKFRLIGDLTMHGVTKEVTLDVEASDSVTPRARCGLAPARRRSSIARTSASPGAAPSTVAEWSSATKSRSRSISS